MTAAHLSMTGAEDTPIALGARYIRWGLGLFVLGLVVGYGPWLHYMHGALDPVQPDFLKNITLWFGCPWTLAAYVAQVGSLAMIVIGLCYVVLGREGAMGSVSNAECAGPVLCLVGILAELVVGYAGHFATNAIYPNYYYTPIRAGIYLWLGLQGACIAIYLIGVAFAYQGIKRAAHAMAAGASAVR